MRQQTVADRVGVTLRAYQAWEAGDAGIKWENLESLAQVLETKPDFILYGERDSQPDTPDVLGEIDRLARIERRVDDLAEHAQRVERMLGELLLEVTGREPSAEAPPDPSLPEELQAIERDAADLVREVRSDERASSRGSRAREK